MQKKESKKTNKTPKETFKIRMPDDGLKITKWFKKSGIKIPFALFQKLLRKGAVKVNGKKIKPEHVLNVNDIVEFPLLKEPETGADGKKPKRIIKTSFEDAQALLIENIIYQDDEIIAINKPQGLPTQGGSKVNLSVDVLLDYLKESEDGERPRLIHRLDKDTSGVLLIAKTAAAASKFAQSFKHKDFEKHYIALVVGEPKYDKGVIDAPLLEKALQGTSEKTIVSYEEGKQALTEYKVLKLSGEVSLLQIKIISGRKHQIRVHLAHIGCPVVGDGKYGGRLAFVHNYPESLHLHAYQISHPLINNGKKITAPLSENLDKAARKLKVVL
jgi:23S rRNA pseudouridine955/2504/2580 synthase